ncbi:hypothetical protein CC2G_002814 [Coprinopsis cinerea AmutBmut pab1-1]|nr:hypothetical protein CC2G_002814 [Coprinopsis cinerea AmutBmut pab1-1]
MSPFIPAPPVIPISVIVHENPTQAPITLTEPHPLYNLFYTLAATLIFTASVLRELTLVSFDNDDEGDDWDLVDRRSREIREYLMLHFPVIKFVGDVHSDINKNPDGDETPFQSEILQDRRQIRHTIFVDVALYIALNRALTGGNSESPPYDDPSYRPLLTFFLHVCLLHELGHIIRSVFASKPSPSKDDLHDAPSQKQKQVRKGQVGFDVERGVLGGRVVLGYATNPPPVRQWENVKVVGFRKLDGQTHYLSCAQHGMSIYFYSITSWMSRSD